MNVARRLHRDNTPASGALMGSCVSGWSSSPFCTRARHRLLKSVRIDRMTVTVSASLLPVWFISVPLFFDTATTYRVERVRCRKVQGSRTLVYPGYASGGVRLDRKSTRLNSSHQIISYAVFCL